MSELTFGQVIDKLLEFWATASDEEKRMYREWVAALPTKGDENEALMRRRRS